tara:strand:+ start:7149 stop:8225 length:1077 start_codon:yes stop_codon:yes gene_type:complete
MAYTFFPKQRVEIEKELESKWSVDIIKDIQNVFSLLVNKAPDGMPIAIDPDDKRQRPAIKVSRAFQITSDISSIRKNSGISHITISFGNGSKGNRGKNNTGNEFEDIFKRQLDKWWAGEEVEPDMLKAIENMNKTYKMSSAKTFEVKEEGAANTKRPLAFDSIGPYVTNPKGKGFDIGQSVTDLTVILNNKQKIYLSLKLGNTTTFFNLGIKKQIPTNDVKNNSIKGDGLKLLNTLGMEPTRFCDVFNGVRKASGIVRTSKYNKNALERLLKTGIGMNYHVIHKIRKTIISKKMDQKALKAAHTIQGPITVYYGGKGGSGKRVQAEFKTQSYFFSINLRDTAGAGGYPNRIMCDFRPL